MAVSPATSLAQLVQYGRSAAFASTARGGRVGQLAGGLGLAGHVGQHELDALEVGDALAELLAVGGVGDRRVERALRDAHRLRGDREPRRSRVAIAILKPSPSAPSRFAAGTRTSSNVSSAVGEPRMPILCSTRGAAKPGVSVSTMKALIPLRPPAAGSVRAKTVSTLATEPWVMKRLLPLST